MIGGDRGRPRASPSSRGGGGGDDGARGVDRRDRLVTSISVIDVVAVGLTLRAQARSARRRRRAPACPPRRRSWSIAEKAIVTGGSASTVTISSGAGRAVGDLVPVGGRRDRHDHQPGARCVSTTAVTTGPFVSCTSSSVPDVGGDARQRHQRPVAVADRRRECVGHRRDTAAAAADTPRSATAIGDVVALIAIGESWRRGVTVNISIATATSPIVPVAIANARVERWGSVCRIACRSAAATSDGCRQVRSCGGRGGEPTKARS